LKIRYILVYLAALTFAVFIIYRSAHHDYYNAVTVTGATPKALSRQVPSGFGLSVEGMTKKTYRFSHSALRAFATTRIRTKEISPGGNFLGTYMYSGIPVFNILEGVAPEIPSYTGMDTPTDFLVTFVSRSGKRVFFSYGELVMTGDNLPVTLAYHCSQLLPTKDPDKYTYNLNKDELKGLRLIAPKEPDTSRYLDDVESIILSVPEVSGIVLPKRKKKCRCVSDNITVAERSLKHEAVFTDVGRSQIEQWTRVGHGTGYKGTKKVSGYRLAPFLETNFADIKPDDFFLFVSCDGYRCLFSAREIFSTTDGKSMVIIDDMDGKRPSGGNMLACLEDYFIDRSIWGVSYVVRLIIDGDPLTDQEQR